MQQRWIGFLVRATIAGLAVAFVIAYLFPALAGREQPLTFVKGADSAAPASYSEAIAQVFPAVVSVYTQSTVPSPRKLDDPALRHFEVRGGSVRAGLGSGVIMSESGYVLTNYHVVARADDVRVRLADGRVADAVLAGSDPDSDLAVLKIDLDRLPAISLGRSADLAVGDVVLAIGNTIGIGQTVTQGIVSATGRNQLYINPYEDYIQTDAAINQGNSGGALVNANGELVGINTAIIGSETGIQGVGFAIPADFATNVMVQILETGKVVRGWLGIVPIEAGVSISADGNLQRRPGVIANGIYINSPADSAGLEPGDLILALQDRPVNTRRDFFDAEAALPPGSEARIRVRRGTAETTLVSKVIQRPPPDR